MIIGTVRPEEAKVFDGSAGFHPLTNADGVHMGASIEVFWSDGHLTGSRVCDECGMEKPGWYWWACHPGCLPDGEANGPFASSHLALADASEWWD